MFKRQSPTEEAGCSKNAERPLTMNILVVGDSGIGKTWLISRFVNEQRNWAHVPTIGVDFKVKTVAVGDKKVKLTVWDTAGLERFNSLTESSFRRADGVLLAFDITLKSSFDNLPTWISHVNLNCPESVVKMLIGTKRDASVQRTVTEFRAQQFAEEQNCVFHETSAKDNINVDKVFHDLAESILKHRGELSLTRSAKMDQFRLLNSDDTWNGHAIGMHDKLSDLSAELLNEQVALELENRKHKTYLRQHESALLENDLVMAEKKRKVLELQRQIHKLETELPSMEYKQYQSHRKRRMGCCMFGPWK